MVSENSQIYTGGGNKKNPDVIYYRNRRGWITWGDTQASKQLDMINGKGCVPLPKYGKITHSEDLWGPILRHPDGPAEFPVDQILAFRWYDKRRMPDLRPVVQVGREQQRVGTQPVVRFPQLAGVKITEYPCPEGCLITIPGQKPVDKTYHNPIDLGNHLRVMHSYDRSEVLKYGEAMGIDFSKVPGGKELVKYEFDEAVAEVAQDAEEVEFELATVSDKTPATAEVVAEVLGFLSCPDCEYTTEGKTQHEFALQGHRRVKHPEAVPA